MSPRGAYIPLYQYPTPTLANSRLFTAEFASPRPSLTSRLPRPSARTFAISLVTAILLLVFLYPRQQLTWLQQALAGEGIDYRLTFNQLYSQSEAGWIEYEPHIHQSSSKPSHLETWVDKLSDECVERLIGRGEICETWPKEGSRVDAVWTWSNGSDPLLQVWRAEVTGSLTGKVSQSISMVRAAKRAKHFRDHDELRYSIRSALNSFSSGTLSQLHLLTPDLPSNTLLRDAIDPPLDSDRKEEGDPPLSSTRMGQVPTWFSRLNETDDPRLTITHHTEFFANSSNLPTFNSLSIESQLPFLSQIEAEFFLYLNDDTFLLGQDSLVETDVGSPLLGQVFRVQQDLTVGSSAPDGKARNPEGEWASLERANWLLDQRFGKRQRNYIAHIPKAMSMPILREIGMIWKDELEQTASSRFRGRNVEFQLPFLATHYTIESHRQALLFAFIAGRIDKDADGSLTLDERRRMLNELGFERNEDGHYNKESKVLTPFRSTRNSLPELLSQTGLRHPRSTSIECTSLDGHCLSWDDEGGPPVRYEQDSNEETIHCKIELSHCFGDDFLDSATIVSTLDVLKGVAFHRPECGDCLIVQLVSKSGSAGLSAFLPPEESIKPSSRPHKPFNLRQSKLGGSLAIHFDSLTLPTSSTGSRRIDAAREILRYSYVLGDSKSMFHGMRIPKATERILKEISDEEIAAVKDLTFLTLNDDFANDHISELAQPILKDFFQRTWPDPSPVESKE
ncbi:uncharacterized protein JCM6883_007069 [Sporobolomyces salmoneus]|uniref:uncharacterized protein n=1 Tax=Sporobolomyces salmoneus TaxID=183962 RepID=UPI00317CE71C